MRISIIIPIYNGMHFLPDLLNALRNQSISTWEVVLVDDGSTDDSPNICDKYAKEDSRIKVVHKKNGGVSSARNAGLEVAKGDWIGFVDCDDCPKPEMYEQLVVAAERDNCDFAMGAYEKVSETDITVVSLNKVGISQKEQVKKIIFSMAFWNGYLNGESLTTIYGSVWPNIYRTDIIREHNLMFDEEISLGEDLLFNLSYLRYVHKVAIVNKPLYKYNISNPSATRKRNSLLWSMYLDLAKKTRDMLWDFYGANGELEYNIYRQYINYAINVLEEQICMFLVGTEKRKAIRNLCDDELLHVAAAYVKEHGKSCKEKIQARLIYNKNVLLISKWLSKR